ncbi:MAG: divalent cation tolerance protein CutA [Verrucomicrobiota bacterium]|nr:divalent cation tolerance protein CutA [Verrucomicrobiota bacterium]
MVYIFWTCRNREEAISIIRLLLVKRLIACTSLFPKITSLYLWEALFPHFRKRIYTNNLKS